MQQCAICCEEVVSDGDSMGWPGCGHMFHKTCVMNACQYSMKCPVCRFDDARLTTRQFSLADILRDVDISIPASVNHIVFHASTTTASTNEFADANVTMSAEDEPEVVQTMHAQEQLYDSDFVETTFRRIVQRYNARRRRFINTNTKLRSLEALIKEDERAHRAVSQRLSSEWNLLLKREWKENVHIHAIKREYDRYRDRIARRKRTLRAHVEREMGPSPDAPL